MACAICIAKLNEFYPTFNVFKELLFSSKPHPKPSDFYWPHHCSCRYSYPNHQYADIRPTFRPSSYLLDFLISKEYCTINSLAHSSRDKLKQNPIR